MAPRKDGAAGMEYRDFLVIDLTLRTVFDEDVVAALPPNTCARWLVWTDAQGTARRDLITAAASSPAHGWNTSVAQAAVESLRARDVLVRGWTA
jgi:hypothetical protein